MAREETWLWNLSHMWASYLPITTVTRGQSKIYPSWEHLSSSISSRKDFIALTARGIESVDVHQRQTRRLQEYLARSVRESSVALAAKRSEIGYRIVEGYTTEVMRASIPIHLSLLRGEWEWMTLPPEKDVIMGLYLWTFVKSPRWVWIWARPFSLPSEDTVLELR